MKKISVISILIVILLINNYTFSQQVSQNAIISILTCSPGDELYATFGHSAVRYQDHEKGIDWVYNYGTFNFKTKNFYMKFMRGNLNYQLVATKYQHFYQEYTQDNRDVYEQVLNLSYQQKQKLVEYLEWNRLPENKYYQYDFFFDNCATRIRDILQKNIGTDSIKFPEKQFDNTYRDMLYYYLKNIPWERFGINLLLGMPADKKPNTFQSMFLPDYMDTAFTNTILIKQNIEQPFVSTRQQLISIRNPIYEKTFFDYVNPSTIFWIIFAIMFIVSFFEIKNKKIYRKFDGILLLIIGFLGTFMLFMWIGTEHKATANNLNVLWALPTHFIVAFSLLRSKNINKFSLYFLIAGIITLLLIPLWNINPQQYDFACMPIILLLSIRLLKLYYQLKIQRIIK